MLTEEELKRRIEEAGKIRRWYQRIPYGELASPDSHFGDGKTNKRSYGDGRYKFYVHPILQYLQDHYSCDYVHETLCDVGCSAGLYLLRAWQRFSFSRLLGVEAGLGGFAQLQITRDFYDDMPLKIYNARIGQAEPNIASDKVAKLAMLTFPIVDITMMVNTHYHIQAPDLRWYFRALSTKSMFLVVVTDENIGGVIPSNSKLLEEIVESAGNWEYVYGLHTPKDWLTKYPGPNDKVKDLTVCVWKSTKLYQMSVEECFNYQLSANRYSEKFYTVIFPPFIDNVMTGRIRREDLTSTQCYHWQVKGLFGSKAWLPRIALERCQSYYDMILSMKDHGQEQPIEINLPGMVDRYDGFHRVAVLKYLGFKYVYGKDVVCSDPT